MVKLNETQTKVVNNIINNSLLLTKEAQDAIKTTTNIGAVGVGTLGAGAAGYALGLLGGPAGIAVAAIGGATIGYSGLYGSIEYDECKNAEKARTQKIEEYIKQIEDTIWLQYFQDDIQNKRIGMEKVTFDRNHEAIDSYIKYLQESIIELGQENNPDYINKIQNYKCKLNACIKPEKIINFHQDIRYWCAYHKVGEFTPKNLAKGSPDYKEIERIKEKIYHCFKDELKFKKDKNGNFIKNNEGKFIKTNKDSMEEELKIIREKMDRIYKVIEYLKSENTQFTEKDLNQVISSLGKSVLNKINPEKLRDFQILFRKLRYLSQECDFDRENVLKSRFYKDMYGYKLAEWNNSKNGSAFENLAVDFAIIAGSTFLIEMAFFGVMNLLGGSISTFDPKNTDPSKLLDITLPNGETFKFLGNAKELDLAQKLFINPSPDFVLQTYCELPGGEVVKFIGLTEEAQSISEMSRMLFSSSFS
jgi:hypothetical protein